ncbi:MAG: aspartate racemase [Acidobacteria bacterium]|nr:MAG: aspartate racemase [Acidobacteriota bacterium]
MKTVGIIGGIGPESTIEYYRFIIAGYRARTNDDSYPAIIINSVDLSKLVGWMNANELDAVTNYLAAAIEKLARAGADFAALAANTPHIVINQIRERSPLPMISIVEATRDKASALGLRRLGLFGTRFTMQSQFYPETFAEKQITIVVPNEAEQDYIHEKYFTELIKNIFLSETRARLLEIVRRMKNDDAIDGLILGGTELPLILREGGDDQLPFLDTTRIHADAIVDEILS